MEEFNKITINARAAGSIRGISRNLLGGPETAISVIHPNGILGEIKSLIEKGDTRRALQYLEEAKKMVQEIKTHSDNII